MQGEKLSADQPEFKQVIDNGGYKLEQVFNCDESGLYYKLVPTKTLAAHFEKSIAGRKTQKERVTINACSNVTDTINLPLLFIGKAKNLRCFKHIDVDSLPVVYKKPIQCLDELCAVF